MNFVRQKILRVEVDRKLAFGARCQGGKVFFLSRRRNRRKLICFLVNGYDNDFVKTIRWEMERKCLAQEKKNLDKGSIWCRSESQNPKQRFCNSCKYTMHWKISNYTYYKTILLKLKYSTLYKTSYEHITSKKSEMAESVVAWKVYI